MERVVKAGAVMASIAGLLVCGSAAHATDQGITGKKVLLKSNPKMVLLSKDALVVPGANGSSSDPRCVADGGSGSGASIALSDGTNNATLNMPCANWSANGAGTLYKYKDAAGTPKVGKIKAGLLKVVSPGMGSFPVPNGAATVNVEVTIGADKYCMTFVGNGDGGKFLVKDAATGTCACPGAGVSVGGFCWYEGSLGQSCDTVCTGLGLTCGPETSSYAGTGGTDAQCLAVLDALGPHFPYAPSGDCLSGVGIGCENSSPIFTFSKRCTDVATTCAASYPEAQRACACQ